MEGKIIGAPQPEPGTPGLAPEKDAEREAILELGRAWVSLIRELEMKHKAPVKTKVVLGAIDYVKKLMTNNVNAVMDDFTALLKFGRETGKQVHEPYANDGIEAPATENEEVG